MSCSLDTHIRRFRAPFKTRRVTRSEKGLSTSSSVPSSGETDLEKGDAKTHAPAPSAPHMKEGTGSDEGQVVRQGEVCVKECGMHPRSWFRRDRWLSLSETRLALHPAQTKVPRSSILLSDIARLERTDSVPCGLSLQTKNQRRYLLTFGTDGDLYDWQDDISCRSMGVSNPSNFVHQTHATFDPVNGGFTGLPPGWEKVLIRAYEPDESSAEAISLRVALNTSPPNEAQIVDVAVTSAMRIRDVLTLVSYKAKLAATEHTLALAGSAEPLDMARTVADLEGRRELVMLRRPASTAAAGGKKDP